MNTDDNFNLDEELNLDGDLNLSDVTPMSGPGLSNLPNLEVTISAEVGISSMPLHEAEKMTSGTVIMLNKGEGDMADIKINDTYIGKGQIIAENGRYGIKIISLNSK